MKKKAKGYLEEILIFLFVFPENDTVKQKEDYRHLWSFLFEMQC